MVQYGAIFPFYGGDAYKDLASVDDYHEFFKFANRFLNCGNKISPYLDSQVEQELACGRMPRGRIEYLLYCHHHSS